MAAKLIQGFLYGCWTVREHMREMKRNGFCCDNIISAKTDLQVSISDLKMILEEGETSEFLKMIFQYYEILLILHVSPANL